jgi:hypothetical protein
MNTYSWNPSSNCTKVWTDPNCWTNGQFPGPAPNSFYAPQGNVTINTNKDLTITFNPESDPSWFQITDLTLGGSGSLTISAPLANVAFWVLGTLSGISSTLNLTGGCNYRINDAADFSGDINVINSSLIIVPLMQQTGANFSGANISLTTSRLWINSASQFLRLAGDNSSNLSLFNGSIRSAYPITGISMQGNCSCETQNLNVDSGDILPGTCTLDSTQNLLSCNTVSI